MRSLCPHRSRRDASASSPPLTRVQKDPRAEKKSSSMGRTDELPVLGEEDPPSRELVLVLVSPARSGVVPLRAVPRLVPRPFARSTRRPGIGPVDPAADDVARGEGRAERFAGALAAKGAAVVGVVVVAVCGEKSDRRGKEISRSVSFRAPIRVSPYRNSSTEDEGAHDLSSVSYRTYGLSGSARDSLMQQATENTACVTEGYSPHPGNLDSETVL